MSRHRNLKQYMDDYDDGQDDDDDFYDDDNGDDDYGDAPVAAAKKHQPIKAQPKKPQQQQPSGKASAASTAKQASTQQKQSAPAMTLQVTKPSSQAASGSTVLASAEQRSVEELKGILGKSSTLVNDREIQATLEKHRFDAKAAADDLAMQIAKMKISVTNPQSAFTRALEERPAPSSSSTASGHSGGTAWLPSKSAQGFDFSTPSPDDSVAEARKRQERTSPAVKVEPASSKTAGGKSSGSAAASSTEVEQGQVMEKARPEPVKKTKAEEKRDEEDDAADAGKKPLLSLVVVGHVDAGKSTLMGHLLYDLDYVSQKDMHKFEKESKELGKASFKYAWVMDEHAEERERGVTIDVGVKRFETKQRRVVLLDAPGHRDFVPNMITGAAQADAAVLVVPAVAGEFESSFSQGGQTKEHAILVHRLGVQKLIVAVNKMDSCGWDKSRFDFIRTTLEHFMYEEVGFGKGDVQFVPCSGLTGDNLVKRSEAIPAWVDRRTLSDFLDELPPAKRPLHKPLRIVVTEAYKSMQLGPLAVGGKIEAGLVRVDDTVLIAPINVQVKIKTLLVHGESVRRAKAGENVEIGLASKDNALAEQLGRSGIVLCDPKAPVPVVEEFTARIHTLSALKLPILNGSHLMFHAHSVAVPCTVKGLIKTIGPEEKANPRMVKRNETAEVVLHLSQPVCLERHEDFKPLSRFLLRFAGTTIAAGAILEIVK